MNAVLHAVGSIAFLAVGAGALWTIYVHLVAYADKAIDALLMGKGAGDD